RETGNGKRETGEGPRLRAGCDPRSRYSESYFSPLPSFVSLLPSPVSRFPFVPLLRIPETPRLPVDLRGCRLMTEPFRSSDEYDEQAHQLYNEGRYEEALSLLREGLLRYPQSVDLHVGVGYAQLAAEQYAWARQAFELALVLDAEHEDALAGMGEVCLVLGQVENSLRAFHHLIALGYDDDLELMLQVGRALFREGYFAEARRFFEVAWQHNSDSAELAASLGYTSHRLGLDADAFYWLRRSLALDPAFT